MSKAFTFEVLNLEKWSQDTCDYGDLRELTKMQARRMTNIGKKAIDMALNCTKDQKVDYIVYSSRHGELNLSFDLIKSFLGGEIPSPIKFSQSTHNAISGLYCIHSKNKLPATAISAGKESFKMGLLAISNHLLTYPNHKVLFIFADAKPPSVYEEKLEEVQVDKVICALVKAGKGFEYNLSGEFNDIYTE